MTNFDDYLEEQLKDPAFRAEYDALAPVFADYEKSKLENQEATGEAL